MAYSHDTIPVRDGEELDKQKLEQFIKKNIDDLSDDPLLVEQFGTGHSNLTYQLSIGDWEAVLRKPPLGPVAPKAHDMQREFTILKELNPIFPLAPKPYLYNETLLDVPFFLMERRRGIVLDTSFPEGVQPTEDLCRRISETMVDTLVDLHSIDYKKTNLADVTHPDGFMERQVHGWIKRYNRSKTDDLSGIDELTKWMASNIPQSQSPTVIHYDYKLNNAMFAHDDYSEIVGLFDWEMTTVGDPLADLGAAMGYWLQHDDPEILKAGMGKAPVTVMPGFMSRDEFIQSYANKSGRDVSQMNFYLTFAYFKLAVICQQIYYRWKMGQTTDERFRHLNQFVASLIAHARDNARVKR
ncbi:phosphotransferase family protein [Pseudalkalibacillus hwajinpoensis]|uniref:phosphotransferase family protein n=1 Tax=Guptibacillus hwajinpoensis TaxID=208199 RepID=UPI001CD661F0|nr:phosphotransferase family protein [Pseudalkalibacillus hwajinpoensis]MCA0990637.1 phosphotransferase family protein [Pseudalkalibacillus hwajinpoensis]